MKIPHPFPYQGSKRNLASSILSFFPERVDTLIEPFAGSAAVSIAAASNRKCFKFRLNDLNEPLMNLLDGIINNPEDISENYNHLWYNQLGNERLFYDHIRDEFNKTQRADYLLYLLARCVKAAVRYNSKGEFNQSPDNRRKGRDPQKMREEIIEVSRLLNNKTTVTSNDYRETLNDVTESDLIYMDPPYQGVCSKHDTRYFESINFEEFVNTLENLKNRNISFILSYDGRTGNKNYGNILPSELELCRIEINAGRSSQATLLGRDHTTYESIYLSKALVQRLDSSLNHFLESNSKQVRLILEDT